MVMPIESEQTEISRSRLPILFLHKQGKFLDTSSQKGFEESTFRIAVIWVKGILESREKNSFPFNIHKSVHRNNILIYIYIYIYIYI